MPYSGPALAAIMGMDKRSGQSAIDAYLNYYLSNPSEDPGFGTVSQFHGDPFVDENLAGRVLSARNNFLNTNPGNTDPLPVPVAPTPVTPAATPEQLAAAQLAARNDILGHKRAWS
jgi:hypothetical protein